MNKGMILGSPVVWADVSDYAGDGGTRTHQIDLTSLANGAARAGIKADMAVMSVVHHGDRGAYHRLPYRWAVTLRVELDVSATANTTVDLYWGASLSATAATANPGGLVGTDAAYTGTGDTLAESLLQLQLIGSLPLTDDVATEFVLQKTFITTLPLRYGQPVVMNNSGQGFEGDADEMSITFTPLVDEEN